MNTNPETDLDLEKLFLPAWAQEASATEQRFARFTGNESHEPGERKRGGGDRGPRREGGFRPGGPRPAGGGGGPRGDARGPRRDNREGGPRGPGPGRGPQGGPSSGGFRGNDRRDDRRGGAGRRDGFEPREPLPLPELVCTLVPDEKGVDSLTKQIRMTGRAFPLFDIARLILQKPERYSLKFAVKKNAEGKAIQPLFVCALDETIWLSEDEAVAHVLGKHFATFYQADRTATEPPKGVYTFVAQCGMSGVILGPPNYHDYQNQLRKLHAERFARMPFDAFKARVKIVRDEAVVKQWVEEQSWKTEYVCLNVPEPLKLATRAEVEQHFRATHKDTIIKPVESQTISGAAARGIRSPELSRLVRFVTEDQRRFPLQIATVLSQQFAQRGLQFFKKDKTVTHVGVARPSYLDLETTPVSDGIRAIVELINATSKCTRRKLVEALAPSPTTITIAAPTPVAEGAAPETTTAPEPPAPTPEQTAVISDLHWLIHQGHVLEFANGVMETAKKPLPRPPKPAAKPAPATAAAAVATPQTAPAESDVVDADPGAPAEAVAPSETAPTESGVPTADSAAPVVEVASESADPVVETAAEVSKDTPSSENPA